MAAAERTTITARLVGTNESEMSGPERTIDFQLDGHPLSLTLRPAPGQPPIELRWKLVRVEEGPAAADCR